MQPLAGDQTHTEPFTKKLTSEGLRYSASINKTYEKEEGVKFFQSACDLAFCQNGGFYQGRWSSGPNDLIDVELETTEDGGSIVKIKAQHMNVGYLVFCAGCLPFILGGLNYFIHLMLGSTDGISKFPAFTLTTRGAMPVIILLSLWIGYKKYTSFVENGLKKLLAALEYFPDNADYNTVLKALPESEKGPGLFRSYGVSTHDMRITPDTDMRKLGCHAEGYLYRNSYWDVDFNYIPRTEYTVVEFRARPELPLGILIGVFIALWFSWIYFLGYKFVIKFGHSATINNLALSGFFIAFFLMVIIGWGIMWVRKKINDRRIIEAMEEVEDAFKSR